MLLNFGGIQHGMAVGHLNTLTRPLYRRNVAERLQEMGDYTEMTKGDSG